MKPYKELRLKPTLDHRYIKHTLNAFALYVNIAAHPCCNDVRHLALCLLESGFVASLVIALCSIFVPIMAPAPGHGQRKSRLMHFGLLHTLSGLGSSAAGSPSSTHLGQRSLHLT